MRILLMLIVCLAIGVGVYFFAFSKQQALPTTVLKQQNNAQDKAAIYNKTQVDMMKQLGQ